MAAEALLTLKLITSVNVNSFTTEMNLATVVKKSSSILSLFLKMTESEMLT